MNYLVPFIVASLAYLTACGPWQCGVRGSSPLSVHPPLVAGFDSGGRGHLAELKRLSTDPGPVDLAATSDGDFLYAQTGGNGVLDEFRVGPDGALTPIGTVTVPGSVGGEGIAAS